MNRRAVLPLLSAFAATLITLFTLTASAQTWPARPISMVVVFAAGGTTDIVGRQLAAKLGTQLGQQVLVENRVGAGGVIGAASVARAKPDGHTMLMLTSTHAVGETLYKDRPYDLVRDFAPVSNIGTTPYWLLVNPQSTRANTLAQLLARMRAEPGKLTYASGGAGGLTHLASEMMRLQAGVQIVHVPFKGNGPALTEVIAGRVDMIFDQPASSEAHVKAGKVKPLAVTSRERLPDLPEVPALSELGAEFGMEGFEAEAWFGLHAHKSASDAVVARMSQAAQAALADPALRRQLSERGTTPRGGPPEAYARLVHDERARWLRVVRNGAVQVD